MKATAAWFRQGLMSVINNGSVTGGQSLEDLIRQPHRVLEPGSQRPDILNR